MYLRCLDKVVILVKVEILADFCVAYEFAHGKMVDGIIIPFGVDVGGYFYFGVVASPPTRAVIEDGFFLAD